MLTEVYKKINAKNKLNVKTQPVVETPEDVIKYMDTDLGTYKEWLDGLACIALRNDAELFQSWKDWFEGREPK